MPISILFYFQHFSCSSGQYFFLFDFYFFIFLFLFFKSCDYLINSREQSSILECKWHYVMSYELNESLTTTFTLSSRLLQRYKVTCPNFEGARRCQHDFKAERWHDEEFKDARRRHQDFEDERCHQNFIDVERHKFDFKDERRYNPCFKDASCCNSEEYVAETSELHGNKSILQRCKFYFLFFTCDWTYHEIPSCLCNREGSSCHEVQEKMFYLFIYF